MTEESDDFGDHPTRPGQEIGSAEDPRQSQDGRVGSRESGSPGGGGLTGSPRQDSSGGGGGEEQPHRGSDTPPTAGTASPSTSGGGSRSRPGSVVGVSSQIRGYVTRKVPVQRAAAGAGLLFATPAAHENDGEEEGQGEEEMDDDPPPAPMSEDFLALAVRLPSFTKPGHELTHPLPVHVPVPLVPHVKSRDPRLKLCRALPWADELHG